MKLKKAVYGLRQSGGLWHLDLKEKLLKSGATQCDSDGAIFLYKNVIIVTYVDDILWVGPQEQIQEIRDQLGQYFTLKPVAGSTGGDEIKFRYLGVMVEYVRGQHVKLSQEALIQKILVNANMTEARPAPTPILPGQFLPDWKIPTNSTAEHSDSTQKIELDYRNFVGSLQYLASVVLSSTTREEQRPFFLPSSWRTAPG